ncbi:Beta-galactosidase [bacterium HR19]|nr:Beta-galactosidase [bacterium HR19]
MPRKTFALILTLLVSVLELNALQTYERKFLVNGQPTLVGIDAGMFQDTNTRLKIDLAGKWLAKIEGEKKWSEVLIPSAYDFNGKVIFRKNFELPDSIVRDKTLFLVAYGINYECQIFINGQFLTRHIGGYTSFVVRIPDRMLNIGENVLEIRISNELNSKSTIPLRPQVWAWRNYGGIYRDIYILTTPKVLIDYAKVNYSFGTNYGLLNGEVEGYISSDEISKIFTDKNFFCYLLFSFSSVFIIIPSSSSCFR